MSKTLFEEAVADANKLRELAEETAKNKVIEAVMPQIRNLINRQILGEDIDIDEEILSMPEIEPESESLSDFEKEDSTNVKIGPSEDDPAVHISVDGDLEIDLDIEDQGDEEDLVVDQAMAEALTRLISGDEEKTVTENKLEKLEKTVSKLSGILESVNVSTLSKNQLNRLKISYFHCIKESIRLKSDVVLITEDTTQERLEARLTETIKEIRKMSKSNRRNIFDFLFEGEDEKKKMEELEEAELSLELTADEQEELADAEDADAVGDALEDILGDIELSLDAGEGAEEGEEPEAEEEPAEEEEEEEEELDLEEGAYEGHQKDMDEAMYEGEVYEIDENMLRRELQRMNEEAADADPALAHGGEEIGDVLLDVSEEDLINALADELGSADSAPAVAAESRRRSGALVEARREITQYKKAIKELKVQLVEMNLFNAKLLYANKLMQNKDLTLKQQKAIVEALDNAKTLREAKLLFKSLTESLNRRTRNNKLNEGSLRTIGSSSRSTRSGAPAKSGVEVDRWAVLAGLNED